MQVKSKLVKLFFNSTVRRGALFSLFSFINRGFSFLLITLLAAYISPTDYGYLSLWGTILMLFSIFIALSGDSYISVSFFADGKVGVGKYFTSISIIMLLITSLSLIVLVFLGETVSKYTELPLKTIYLALLISILTVYTNMNLDFLRINEDVKKYGIYSCSNTAINFVLSIFLIVNLKFGWEGRIYAQLVTFFCFALISIYTFSKNKLIGALDWAYWKRMVVWGLPLIPHVATTFIKQGCDRFIINSYYDISDVGVFSFAMNMSNIILMVGTGFNQTNSVEFYKILSDDSLTNRDKVNVLNRRTRYLILLYGLVSLLVFSFIYFVLPFCFPKYVGSVNYMPILSINAYLSSIVLIYTNYMYYYGKTKSIMYITFITSIVHLSISYFITKYSLYYTSIIYIISQLSVLILVIYNVKKIKESQLN